MMEQKKVYTSSIPEVAQKQRDRAKEAIRQQLPLIVECLVEDEAALAQLATALQSVQPTKKVETKKSD